MAITDLTGTTWLINSTISEPQSTILAEINFTSNGENFRRIGVYDGFEPGTEQLINYTPNEQGASPIFVYEYGWSNEAYRTIAITDGNDVTNSSLISWLEANATNVTPSPPTVAISYNNVVIATMDESGTKTLETEGKYCTDDIMVEYTKPTLSLQNKTVSPTTTSQSVTADSGYDGLGTVTVNAMPSGTAKTPGTMIAVLPTLTLDNEEGIVDANNYKVQSVTPTVTAGYVSSGTAGRITVTGQTNILLPTKDAQTYTPTTTNQTIAQYQWLTGAQTILGDAALIPENIAEGITIFGVTGTHSGGGNVNILTLYVQVTTAVQGTLYLDSGLSTAFDIEMFDYDYQAAYAYVTSFDFIKIIGVHTATSNDRSYMIADCIYFDPVDETLLITASYKGTRKNWYV